MADKSAIEWTDATWNPIVGCSIVSPGCTNCYAMKMAARIERMGNAPHYDDMTQGSKAGPVWTGKVARASEETLTQPLRWKKPRRIFVNSMGDLFHESIPDEWIDCVFAVMALAPQHTFQVLTKRAERMRAYLTALQSGGWTRVHNLAWKIWADEGRKGDCVPSWPLSNVWLGVSTERQQEADKRIPLLLNTPAAVRFISAEPLLGPINLKRLCIVPQKEGSSRAGIHVNALAGRYCESGMPYLGDWDVNGPCPPASEQRRLDWVIVGGESGHGARPMHPDWARLLRYQCAVADVPFFFKQWGEWAPYKPVAGGDLGGEVRRGIARVVHPTGQTDLEVFEKTGGRNTIPGTRYVKRIGKKSAGRLLDGKEHNSFPQAKEVAAA